MSVNITGRSASIFRIHCLIQSSIRSTDICSRARLSSSANNATGEYLVPVQAAKDFVKRSMESVGTKPAHADALAEVLILADQRGHYSHGLNRLEKYIIEIETDSADKNAEPVIEKETVSTALIDGKNALGCVVGNFAMQTAINKAKESGVGWVAAHSSNHYGIAGIYGLQAVKQGMMGLSFTNGSPFLVPTRSRDRFLGTNPIACAAPSSDPNDEFCLDMATTTVAQGKIEVAHRKGEAVPHGWGSDAKGQSSTDAGLILDTGGLMPLGGAENTSGYKGSGLAMMVEVLCGILSGAHYATNIRTWDSHTGYANLGQCFIAVNPDAFALGFQDRLNDLMTGCRKSNLAEGETDILVAGEPERNRMRKVETDGGIFYHPNFIQYLDGLAEKCNITPISRTFRSA